MNMLYFLSWIIIGLVAGILIALIQSKSDDSDDHVELWQLLWFIVFGYFTVGILLVTSCVRIAELIEKSEKTNILKMKLFIRKKNDT